MKTLFLSFALLLSTQLTWAQTSLRFELDNTSSMEVHGGSTIHDWKAFVSSVSGYVVVKVQDGQLLSVDTSTLSVKVADMDAKNGTMNSKMREALKSKDHPVISYVFDSAQKLDENWLTKGNLTIAGATRPVESSVELLLNEENQLMIKGSFEMSMEAYNMKAPTAMMGTIKTHDRLIIHFTLSAEAGTARAQN